MKSIKKFLIRILYSLLPLAYGIFVWIIDYKLSSYIRLEYPFNILFRTSITIGIIALLFGKSLNKAYETNQLQFFGYNFNIPSWKYFAASVPFAILINLLQKNEPIINFEFGRSLIYGVIVSVIIEELIARSFLIKNKINISQFFLFNTISSIAFTIMHTFYYQDGISLHQLILNGHFAFSFTMGILAYKTQRIEVPIIIHMLSNLMRYTIPVCLFNSPWPSTIAASTGTFVDVTVALCLTGLSYKQKEYLNLKQS